MILVLLLTIFVGCHINDYHCYFYAYRNIKTVIDTDLLDPEVSDF